MHQNYSFLVSYQRRKMPQNYFFCYQRRKVLQNHFFWLLIYVENCCRFTFFSASYQRQKLLQNCFLWFFWKINQSEMNILLVILFVFVGSQPIRIQHFLKKNFLSNFKNLNRYLKNVYQKNLTFLELLYKNKKFQLIFLLMKKMLNLHNFLDVFLYKIELSDI